MKKLFWVLLVVIFCMSGCSSDNSKEISDTDITTEATEATKTTDADEATDAKKETESTDATKETDATEATKETDATDVTDTTDAKAPETADSNSGYNENLEPVALGMLDVAEFGVGSSGADIEAAMGKPIDEGYYLGGLYMSYGAVVYLTNGTILDDNTADYGQVTYVSYTGDDYVLGIKIGMTIEECSAIIGEPDEIIPYSAEEGDSELYGENWRATYHVGEYDLDLIYESENAGINQVLVRGAF